MSIMAKAVDRNGNTTPRRRIASSFGNTERKMAFKGDGAQRVLFM
jgi:hypothetical protein